MVRNLFEIFTGSRWKKPVEQMTGRELVDQWTEENLGHIIRAMIDMREDKLESWKNNSEGLKRLNSLEYSISEMPLCGFWRDIKPPVGFEKIGEGKGEALLYRPSDPEKGDEQEYIDLMNHQFGMKGSGEVVCFCFSQFYDYQFPEIATQGFKPGDRVRKYRDMAPDLITEYRHKGVSIARLFGETRDIRDRLGLWYRKRV